MNFSFPFKTIARRRAVHTRSFTLALAVALMTSAWAETPPDKADEITIVVSANRSPTHLAKVGSAVTIIPREVLERERHATIKDVLEQVPGLSFTQNGPTGSAATLQMRGANASYVLVRVDGMEISNPSSTQVSAALEHLLAGDVERIEILRGSQSALYGGTAVAGVIDITTRKAPKEGISQSASVEGGSYGTLAGSYGISAANETSQVNVTAQRLHSRGFSAANRRYGNTERDGYENLTLSANGSTQLSDAVRLFAATRFTRHDIQFDDFVFGSGARDELPGNPRNHSRGQSFSTRLGTDFTLLEGRLRNTLAGQYYTSALESFGTFPSRYEGDRRKLEYLGNLSITDQVGLSFGADHMMENASSTAGLSGSIRNTGIFGQLSWQPFRTVTLTAALRDDIHARFGTHMTHRMTAAWEVLPGTKLRASQSSGFRPPSVFELFAGTYGNPDLKPETSRSFDAGIDQTLWQGRATLSATWFTLTTTDLIDFAYDPAAARYRYIQVPGTTKRAGVELAGRVQVSQALTLDASYTYIDARKGDGTALLRVPRHKVGLGATLTPFDKTTLNVRGTFVANMKDTDYAIVLPDFSSPVRRLPAWFLLDATIAYKIRDNLEASLRGKNLLNRKYETVWGYGTPGRTIQAGLSARF
jgi:vitamin B12 transporter